MLQITQRTLDLFKDLSDKFSNATVEEVDEFIAGEITQYEHIEDYEMIAAMTLLECMLKTQNKAAH